VAQATIIHEVIGLGLGFLATGFAMLAVASFFAFDPARRATGVVHGLAGISAMLGNQWWLKRTRLLRWWFAFVPGVIGVAFVLFSVATLSGHGPS
jgi:hypothetical protein